MGRAQGLEPGQLGAWHRVARRKRKELWGVSGSGRWPLPTGQPWGGLQADDRPRQGGLAHFDRRLCHREGACLTQAGWIEIGAQKWEGVSLTVLEGVLLTQKLDGSWQEEVG